MIAPVRSQTEHFSTRHVSTLALLLVLSSAAVAFAQTAPPPKQEATAELAFVGTTGNTSTSTFSAGGEHIARPDGWLIKNKALAIRSASDGLVTAESFLYAFRAEHTLNARVSAFGQYGFFRDKPAGIQSRNEVAGGLAFKVIATDRQSFGADASFGYLNEQRLAGADVSSATYGAGTLYKVKLSETSDLTDEVRLLGTFDIAEDWRVQHAIALTARLTTLLSLKVSSVVRFANLPPIGFKRTDTTTAVALVLSFKKP